LANIKGEELKSEISSEKNFSNKRGRYLNIENIFLALFAVVIAVLGYFGTDALLKKVSIVLDYSIVGFYYRKRRREILWEGAA
jgi:hypothetical protein